MHKPEVERSTLAVANATVELRAQAVSKCQWPHGMTESHRDVTTGMSTRRADGHASS